MPHVAVVNFTHNFIVTDDGAVLPIIGWFDSDNAPTTDWSEAVAFVAGGVSGWYLGRMADWKPVVVN